MGREAKARSERIHLKKLFDGKMTANEAHWSGLRKRCTNSQAMDWKPHAACGRPPVIEVLIFCPGEDYVRLYPQQAVRIARQMHGKGIPCVYLKGPDGGPRPFVGVLHAFACRDHRLELERFAARAPSSHFVDIRRGPGADNPIVAVA